MNKRKINTQIIISTFLVVSTALITIDTYAESTLNTEAKKFVIMTKQIMPLTILNIDINNQQTSQGLASGSKLFLTFSSTKGEKDVDGNDAIQMLKSYFVGKTNCVIVNSLEEADFVVELSVVKKAMANRNAMVVIKHIDSNQEIFKTKWVKGASTAFYGYSGARAAIGKLMKKYILKRYPEIKI
tara:strand:+ start:665 stop:1219 length:555 start_codon:yes stop_codon:yes gene_type:complete